MGSQLFGGLYVGSTGKDPVAGANLGVYEGVLVHRIYVLGSHGVQLLHHPWLVSGP
jgi:hypothetical protein